MTEFFRVLVDGHVGDLWFLGKPLDQSGSPIDARRFTSCEPFGTPEAPLRIPVQQPGRPARLSFGAFDMPVVDGDLARSFGEAGGTDIELIPAVADNGAALAIANVLPCADCIDESRTVGEKWDEDDGRPDRTGAYRMIVRLRIHPSGVKHDVFRPHGWKIALIVSDRFADATRLDSIEGTRLESVG